MNDNVFLFLDRSELRFYFDPCFGVQGPQKILPPAATMPQAPGWLAQLEAKVRELTGSQGSRANRKPPAS